MKPLFDQRQPAPEKRTPHTKAVAEPNQDILRTVRRFIGWLDHYGEVSHDFQTLYANRLGQRAKALYYKKPALGTLAVAPIIFCEAFVPSAKRLFYQPQRFPIADAHYAMGFLFLSKLLRNREYYTRAIHFLEVLEQTRCSQYDNYSWGY